MSINIGNLKLYSVKELSKTLNVTTVTLRSYIKKGKLKGQKVGVEWYVTEESLREFFNSNILQSINT